MNLINQMKENGHVKIYELANSNIIDIPAVQRSLVWKPAQVELLWDSILRGFPIGAFILSEHTNGFYLMDGQQRFNAICLGFSHLNTNKSKLWIDIAPNFSRNSTRKFLVKATTISHPWGFNNDDECSSFRTNEKRSAMKMFGNEGKTLFQAQISIDDTWPVKANCPIPLHILLENAELSSSEEFATACINGVKNENKKYQENLFGKDINIFERLKLFYEPCRTVRTKYFIPFSLLDQAVVENEQGEQQERSATTDIEVLFQRITTGGTRITQAELNYSAVKVYWPDIKDICEETALKCMPAYDLANMLFRLYKLINNEKGEWVKGNLRLSEIRNLSKSNYEQVNDFFIHVPGIVDKVNNWLTEGHLGMPPILKTAVARQSPDIYLLALWLATQKHEINGDFIRAMVLFLKWQTTDYSILTATIYQYCNKEGISEASIIKGIYDCRNKNVNVVWPYPSNHIRQMLDVERFNKDWNQWKLWGKRLFDLWIKLIRNPWEFPDMLLYAEREYMKTRFPYYDPSQRDMWESVNRPWDYDHIVPHDWIYNRKSGEWRPFCKEWLNVIGNLAAIPFERNRAKGNTENWEYYKKHENDLFVSPDVYCSQINRDIVYDDEMAKSFARITIERTLKLYDEAYKLLKIITESDVLNSYPTKLLERKQRILTLKEIICTQFNIELILRYCNPQTGLEYCVEYPHEWVYPGLWLEKDITNEISLAVSLSNEEEFKIGFRISPNMRHKNENSESITNRLLSLFPDMTESSDAHWYANVCCSNTDLQDLAEKFHEITINADRL